METLSPSLSISSLTSISKKLPVKASSFKLYSPIKNKNHIKTHSLSSSSSFISLSTKATTTSTCTPTSTKTNKHWMILMESPPKGVNSKPEIIDYYVKTLERVIGRSVGGGVVCVFNDDPFWYLLFFWPQVCCFIGFEQ